MLEVGQVGSPHDVKNDARTDEKDHGGGEGCHCRAGASILPCEPGNRHCFRFCLAMLLHSSNEIELPPCQNRGIKKSVQPKLHAFFEYL